LNARDIPCKNKNINDMGINDFSIYLAGNPPASGDVSLN
jgi:hypothetical protein